MHVIPTRFKIVLTDLIGDKWKKSEFSLSAVVGNFQVAPSCSLHIVHMTFVRQGQLYIMDKCFEKFTLYWSTIKKSVHHTVLSCVFSSKSMKDNRVRSRTLKLALHCNRNSIDL